MLTTYNNNNLNFQPDSSLVVLVFQKGDDPIDAINHMMSFLTAVVTSRGRVYCQQCTKPRGKGLKTWFNNNVLLVQAQAGGKALTEEDIDFCRSRTSDILTSLDIAVMTSSVRSNDVSRQKHVINSDLAISLPYSQLLSEHNRKTVLNSNSSAQHDVLILVYIQEEVKILKESKMLKTVLSGSNEQLAEISVPKNFTTIPGRDFGLRDIVVHVKENLSKDPLLESAFRSKTFSSVADHSLHGITQRMIDSASIQVNYKKQIILIMSDSRNDCMFSDNLCVSNSLNDVKSRAKPNKNKPKKDIWKPTGKVFTQIGYT
ncbi:hypothetical protein Tco_1547596 [Tanacetum coccineum]